MNWVFNPAYTGVLGNLSGTEAAELARQIGARWAVPCHYEMFRFNTASPDEFARICDRLGQHTASSNAASD